MNITRTAVAAGVGIASAALILTGCGGGNDTAAPPVEADGEITGEIQFQTWSLTPKYQAYLDGVISAFEAEHPGTTVTLIDQPGDGYDEKVLSQASTNSLPDVMNLPPDFALPLAEQEMIVDVSQVSDVKSTYFEGALDSLTYPGIEGVYGFPWYLGTNVNYWNATKLDECGLDSKNPPSTTDELLDQAAKMTEACPDTYLMSRKPGLDDFTLAGVDILNDDGTEFVFNTSKAADLVDRYAEAYAGGLMPSNVLNDDYLGNSQLFTEEKVAWTTGGPNAINDFERDNPNLTGKIVVNEALDVSPIFVQALSVSAGSKNLATALAFAEFATNADNQNAFAREANVLPSTKGSEDDPFFSEEDGTVPTQARVLAYESLQTAELLTPVTVNSAMSDIANQQISLAIRGDISGQEALDAAVERMNSLLARQ